MIRTSVLTAVFLVLLRLAIGWHFLFEGLHKIHSTYTDEVFSSKGYFHEAHGPFGPMFRKAVGDVDDEALACLTLQPLPPDQSPKDLLPSRFPPALAKDWDAYRDALVARFDLDENQRKRLDVKLEQAKANYVVWLDRGEADVTKTYPGLTYDVKLMNLQRVAEYRAKLDHLHEIYEHQLPAFGNVPREMQRERIPALKAEIESLRKILLKDVNVQTTKMKDSLNDVLTSTQAEQLLQDTLPKTTNNPSLEFVDWLTRWGLTVMGGCLLAGLFTRLACLSAAGFLLMTYLNTPAFPWLPVAPNTEGYYLYVNKNVIEFLALLALATTASGRWLGIDAILHAIGRGLWSALFGSPTQSARR
jgi:uncharacterized membrane protein YphA (DoxX/SURF4 family)